MHHQFLLLATLLPTALCVTTLQAILAPPNAAASVFTIQNGATTYVLKCTASCPSNSDKTTATLVQGTATAGLTIAAEGKTLIRDCNLAVDRKGDCTTKAISAGETRTGLKEILTFQDIPVVVTGGLDKLGYVVVETTMEVNTTVTERATSKTASKTVTVAASATLTESSDSSTTTKKAAPSSDTATITASATAATGLYAAGPGVLTSSSAGAAPTMKAGIVGGAIAGLAGLMMVAL